MPFLFIRNDITKLSVDAIVNPANEDLLEGSGTSRAIFLSAGEKNLKEACRKIGHCDLGRAVRTDAFEIDAKHIFHAVCPLWTDGNHEEAKILYNTYMETMKLARGFRCESLAFPLLSSGNYGFPKELAMKIAVSAISDFLMQYDMLIYMVLYDRDSLMVSRKLFTSINEYIDDNYVDKLDEIYSKEQTRSPVITCAPQCFGQTAFVPDKSVKKGTPNKKTGRYKIGFNTKKLIEDECIEMEETSSIIKNTSLENAVEHLDETFSQMLLRLIDERGLKDSLVYKKANIDRRHFSKIRNDIEYCPTKKTVISFVLALSLSMNDATELMKKAGFAFSNSSKFDVIICYFIEHKDFDIFEINEVLFAYGQPILGE